MEKDFDLKASVADLSKELDSSSLLNINFNKEGCLEIIPPSINDFFDGFELGKEFEFTSFFDNSFSSEDGMVDFCHHRILRKAKYSKKELEAIMPKSLLFPYKITSCSLPLNQDRSLAFLEKQADLYLAFGNYYYQQKDQKSISCAPLVFFKIKIRRWDNTYYLSLDSNSPFYNLPLFSYLKKFFNLSLDIDKVSFDPDSLIKTINEESSSLSFAADNSISILNISILQELRLANVVDYALKMESDSIFNFSNNIKPPLQKIEHKLSHPQYINEGLKELASCNIASIDGLDKTSEEFIKAAVDETFLNKGNVLLIGSSELEKEELLNNLEKRYYDAFTCYGDISAPGTALFSFIESASLKPGYLVDSSILIKKDSLSSLKDSLTEIDKKLKKEDLPTEENAVDFYKHYEKYKVKSNTTYKFNDNDEYTYENYLADMDFISFVNANVDFKEKPFTSHPFYGLNSNVKSSQYEDIIRFLSNMGEDISKFQAAIDKAQIKASGWSDFNSLKDYDDSNKLFTIFSKYDGFPIEYFKIKFTDELLTNINDLISYFRLEAPIRLSIDVLCQSEIWQMDFSSILESVDDRKKEKILKKEMKDIIKIPPFKKSFKTLIVLIDKFQDNLKSIQDLLPKVEAVFPKENCNLDGLLAIKSAYDFILAYQRHQKLYDDLNFNNPFTDKIFNDKNFSYKYKIEYYPSLIEMRSVLEHDFDKYRKIFDEDKKDYFSISFEEVKAFLKKRIDASKKQFDDYLTFSYKADAGSTLLRDALLAEEKSDSTLINFQNDFSFSLCMWIMLKQVKKNDTNNLLKQFSETLFTFYRTLTSSNDLERIGVIKSFSLIKTSFFSRPSYQQSIDNLKALYHLKRMFSITEALKVGGDTFFHVYPLTISYLDELTTLYNYKFDLAVVDMRSSTSDLDLFSALMCAKKVIIVGNTKWNFIKKLSFSYLKDFKQIDLISNYPYSFKFLVKDTYLRQDIKLVTDKKIDEHLTVPLYFEKGKEKFALRLADASDSCNYDNLFSLVENLIACYNIKLVTIYPLSYLVYKDLSVMSTYRDVKSLIESMKKISPSEEKMTYDQKRRYEYFATLKKIGQSFSKFTKVETAEPTIDNSPLLKSEKSERLITSISPYEIANGILSYLSFFTFLDEDTLRIQIGQVIGTDDKDVDFRLLFTKAEKYLVENKLINKAENKLSLVR